MAYYDPYEAAKKITEEKQKWANAKAKGEDTSAFETSAAEYYKQLRDNGRNDVADYLQKSDAVQASDYLKQLTPSYTPDAASLQKKSDDLYKHGTGSMRDIMKSYDDVYKNNINVDPTRTGYGKDILTGYGIAADEAYKGTLGGKTAENGGNVDSFAAANANRQKVAVMSQGYGDVLNYYDTIAGRANEWAGGKAGSVGAYLAQLQGNVDADRDVVKKAFDGTVDLWKTQDTNATSKEVASIESDTRKHESDNSLKGTLDYNSALRYDSDNGVKAAEIEAKYGVDVAKVSAEADKYGWDTQRIMNSDTLTSNEKLAAMELADSYGTKGKVNLVDGEDPESGIFDGLFAEEDETEGEKQGDKNGDEVFVKGSILRRLDNAKTADDRIILIDSMSRNGTIDENQLEYLLKRYGLL